VLFRSEHPPWTLQPPTPYTPSLASTRAVTPGPLKPFRLQHQQHHQLLPQYLPPPPSPLALRPSTHFPPSRLAFRSAPPRHRRRRPRCRGRLVRRASSHAGTHLAWTEKRKIEHGLGGFIRLNLLNPPNPRSISGSRIEAFAILTALRYDCVRPL
jgi:hypothetical protein